MKKHKHYMQIRCFRKGWISLLLVLSLGALSCEEGNEKNLQTSSPSKEKIALPKVNVPSFSADSAYGFIEKQVSFGPRVPNSKAHKEAGNWLVEKLKSFGGQVTEQEFVAKAFDGTELQSRNIIATFFPKASKRILLAAHWDSRPFADHDPNAEKRDHPIAGANDGASGVGVLLEIARAIQNAQQKPNVGVDIIFFDSEDYGEPDHQDIATEDGEVYWCLGSQYWSKNKHIPSYSAYYGILLDMVGGHGATFYKEGTSMHYAPKVMENVWQVAYQLGYGNYFINQMADGSITDDHVFVNMEAKIPMIDIVQHDPNSRSYFADYWHTHKDDMDAISKETLKAVGETVLVVLYRE